MLEPAQTVISICGGYAETARMSGRSEVRVRRWGYSKERGGTGGLIPSDCQQTLLDAARAEGKALLPEHFFLGAVARPSTPHKEDAA